MLIEFDQLLGRALEAFPLFLVTAEMRIASALLDYILPFYMS